MPESRSQSNTWKPLTQRLRQRPITDSASQRWDEEIRRAGLGSQPSRAMNTGVPVVAIAILLMALALALFAPNDGDIRPIGVIILILAIAPWGFWLYVGDEGPHWQAVTGLLLPIALLGIGHWFVPAMGPGSDLAYPALVFPPLLLTILAVAIAPTRLAVGIVIAAYIVVGGPLLAALIAGKDVPGTEIVTWHVAIALAISAGYAVRFSNQANAAVTLARESLVRQSASEERRQIARDVHDVVAHSLSVTMLHVTAARLALNRDDTAAVKHTLEEAERLGRASMADIRRIVQVLRADGESAVDMPQPTADQLSELVETYRDAGLDVDASIDDAGSPPGASAGMTLYRILQEALTNAARHGDGTAIVRIETDDTATRLTVTNPVTPGTAPEPPGSGMIGMKERAEGASGTWSNHIDDGIWTIQARIPHQEGT